MRPPRLALLLGALVVPALPLIAAAPAHAATNVICVNRADADCNPVKPATLAEALTAANTDGVDSVIRLGPGGAAIYGSGPYVLDGTSNGSLTVQGNNNGTGAQATIISGTGTAAPVVTMTGTGATLRNVRVLVNGAQKGLDISGLNAAAQNVIVADTDGAKAKDAVGIVVQGAKVQNSTVNLERDTGNTGIQVSGTSAISRVTTRASANGVVVTGGDLDIDNSVIDLGALGTVGLRAGTPASTTAVDVDAKQLTVVGGAAGSRGVFAFTDDAAAPSSVALDNSIVRGDPAVAVAGPTDGLAADATGGTARIDVAFSDYSTTKIENSGVVGVVDGNVDVAPAFRGTNDYALRAGSPVVDKGSLLLTVGTDRDDLGRAFDGDANGSQVPDMGAYELRDITVPKTAFTSGPNGLTNRNNPSFTYKANEDDVTYECRIDAGGWQRCDTGAAATPPLADGPHTFSVRATDAAFNVENPPAVRSFVIDTTVPNTVITKKPQKRFFKQRVKFKFATTESGATFQCNLDDRGWQKCNAKFSFNVKVGKHKMLVRAVDAAGNTDSSPARYKYKRIKRGR